MKGNGRDWEQYFVTRFLFEQAHFSFIVSLATTQGLLPSVVSP